MTQSRRGNNTYPDLDEILETDDEEVIENEYESGHEEKVDDAEEKEGEEDDGLFRVYHPNASVSNALNAFIRVLAVKLPPRQLHTFWHIPSS